MALWVHHEVLGRVEFQFLSFVKEKDLITLDDCVDSMSDCESSSVLELFSDELLDLLLCDNIDVGSSLIQDDDFVTAENGSHNADELLLTYTEIVSFLFDFEL